MRGGGMGGGGGFHGGGMGGGGGFRGGGMVGGGFRGGSVGGFHGGFVGNGFRGNGFRGNFFRGSNIGFRGFGFYGGYWPYAYWPYAYAYSYPYYPYYDSGYAYDPYDYPSYASYSYPSSYQNANYAYPPAQPTTVIVQQPVQSVNPNIREYDQYGQEIRRGQAAGGAPAANGSPVYLIAFNDHVIRAAAAYWVAGNTLHYVTLDHQEHQAAMDSVDRAMSDQLNRERRVQFSLK
jgi:hypothetical protein